METTISCDLAPFLAAMEAKQRGIPLAVRRSVRAAMQVIYNEDRKQINVIYNRPIPLRSNGKPMWQRSKALRGGEKLQYPDPYTGVLTNDTSYAQARHELNKPGAGGWTKASAKGRRKAVKLPPVTRHDPWRTLTVQASSGAAIVAFEERFAIELDKLK